MYEIDARALDRRAPRLGGGDGEDGGGGAGDLLLEPGVFYQAADLDHQQASLRVAGHPSLCLILSSSTACSRHMTQMCLFGSTSCPFAKFASDWLVGSPHCIFLDFLYMLAPSFVFQHRYIMRRRMLPCTPVRLASESGLPRRLGNVTSVTRLAGTPQAVTTTFTYDTTYSQVTRSRTRWDTRQS